MNSKQNIELQITILKLLAKKYSNAASLVKSLKNKEVNFELKDLYPILSGLQIDNFLCSDWMYSNKGNKEKFYHLTRRGLNYINQLKK